MSQGGLDGVIATESAISAIVDGRLIYRGIPIEVAVQNGSFAEIAWLLWRGWLPTTQELTQLETDFAQAWELPREVMTRLRNLPPTTPMLVALREGVEGLALSAPSPTTGGASVATATRLVGALPAIAAQFYHVAEGRPLFAPRVSGSLAARFLYAIHNEEPGQAEVAALDKALILYADHEMNASTFTARVVASTLADLYSAVIAALCTLKGPLHGGATAEAWRFLDSVASPDEAAFVVDNLLQSGARIPGFGHRVYKGPDPRGVICRSLARSLGDRADWLAKADAVAETMFKRKGLYPNIDFYSVVLCAALGLSAELATAVFALGRMAGWTAHSLEQYGNNRIIRPRAQYTGPDEQTWTAIPQRRGRV